MTFSIDKLIEDKLLEGELLDAYCLSCGKEVKDNNIKCDDCGCYSFIRGKNDVNYIMDKDKIKCICGSEDFSFIAHGNKGDTHRHLYECNKCKHIVTIDVNML